MIPTLKLKSNTNIPRLGLGTYMIGGGMKHDLLNDDKSQIESIQYAIQNGIKLIRTAQNYAEGYCEELIGTAISNFKRENLFIIDSIFEGNGVDEQSIISELQKSLKRLKTDYVDMLIIGGLNPKVPIRNIATGLLSAKKHGLTKSLGVGNYRLDELKTLVDIMGDELTFNENHYNLIVREPIINGIYDFQKQSGIIMGAYRPLQLGQLSRSGIELLDELAKKYHKSQSQISLKWLLTQDNIITFPKAQSHSHIDELVDIFSWDMEKEDIDKLTTNFPIQMRMGDCIPPVSSFIK